MTPFAGWQLGWLYRNDDDNRGAVIGRHSPRAGRGPACGARRQRLVQREREAALFGVFESLEVMRHCDFEVAEPRWILVHAERVAQSRGERD